MLDTVQALSGDPKPYGFVLNSCAQTCASTAAWGPSKNSRGWSSTIRITLHVGRMSCNGKALILLKTKFPSTY